MCARSGLVLHDFIEVAETSSKLYTKERINFNLTLR